LKPTPSWTIMVGTERRHFQMPWLHGENHERA
jgi:hypothetical protein